MNVVRSILILGLALTLSVGVHQAVFAQEAWKSAEIVQTAYGCNVQGFCQIHGCENCAHRHPNQHQHYQQAPRLGESLRQAFQPADQPYFGMQPLFTPRYAERAYPSRYPARFPRIRAMMTGPVYMTTQPVEPMNTYTTRGPRDFLHPNPPSIGY